MKKVVRKKKLKNLSIGEVNAFAREKGTSYGKYVAEQKDSEIKKGN